MSIHLQCLPRINFYRPNEAFHDNPTVDNTHPKIRPHGSPGNTRRSSKKQKGESVPAMHKDRANRALYEMCLLNLVLHSKKQISHVRKLPKAIMCDFYGTLYQCYRAYEQKEWSRLLLSEFSDVLLLNRLLSAEHRRSILYGPLQFLRNQHSNYTDKLVCSFRAMINKLNPKDVISRIDYWNSMGIRLGKFIQEMGWYTAASEVMRIVFDLLKPETLPAHRLLFIDTGSRLMHALSCDCHFTEAQLLEKRCLGYIDQLTNERTEIPNIAIIQARFAALNDILCNYSVAKKWALSAFESVSLQLPVKSIVFVFGQASKSCIVAKKFKKAEAIARGAVNIASLYCGTNDPVYSDALMHLGYCNLSIDLTAAAVTCFQRAHTIRREIFGESCVQSAYCHEDLAYSLYVKNYLEGKFLDALNHAEVSIETFTKALGTDHLITASARRVKALIQEEIAIDSKEERRRDQLLQGALKLHKGSLELTVKAFGEDSVPTAKHYGNLGRLYQSLKEFKEAEKYHQDAIRIKEKHLGSDDYEVGLSVGHLAALYCYDMEEFSKAELLYFRSIQIGLKLFGEGFSGLEFDYRGLIHLYKKTDNHSSQVKFTRKFDQYRFKRDQVSDKGATREDSEPLTLLDTLEVLQTGQQPQEPETPMDTSESILTYILSQK